MNEKINNPCYLGYLAIFLALENILLGMGSPLPPNVTNYSAALCLTELKELESLSYFHSKRRLLV